MKIAIVKSNCRSRRTASLGRGLAANHIVGTEALGPHSPAPSVQFSFWTCARKPGSIGFPRKKFNAHTKASRRGLQVSEYTIRTLRWRPRAESRAEITPQAYPLGYLAALDGIRGMMTLAVMAIHSGATAFIGAAAYMDIFFSMSGYLITSLLLADYQKRGFIDFKKFYLRRFARLYPAFCALLAIIAIYGFLFSDQPTARYREVLYNVFYLTDIPSIIQRGYFKFTGHTWSLSVEEQFYLLWPLVLAVLLRRYGVSRTTVVAVLCMAACFTMVRIVLTYSGANFHHLYSAPYCRADSLLIGCAMALILRLVDLRDYPRLSKVLALSLAPLTVYAILTGFFVNPNSNAYLYSSPLFGAIPGAIAIAAIVQPQRTFMHRAFEHPIPVFCGRICYGLYIWHWPIMAVIAIAHADTNSILHGFNVNLLHVVIGWPASFACAIVSYHWIERPFMRARPV